MRIGSYILVFEKYFLLPSLSKNKFHFDAGVNFFGVCKKLKVM